MDQGINKAVNLIAKIKRFVTIFLMFSMLFIVLASVVELAVIIYKEVFDPLKGFVFLEVTELLELFGFFFLILIGIELLETIEMYLKKNVIHAEIVLLIAVIAVSRKVILLDLNAYEPFSIVGLALVIMALGVSYFLIKRSHV